MDTWYYAGREGQVGPLTLAELRDALANIPKAQQVFVWRDGFPDWQPASSVPELGTIVPPPLNRDAFTHAPPKTKNRWRLTRAAFYGLVVSMLPVAMDLIKAWSGEPLDPWYRAWTINPLEFVVFWMGRLAAAPILFVMIAAVHNALPRKKSR
jgi:GYF domain 2